jgi:hypothetical protein
MIYGRSACLAGLLLGVLIGESDGASLVFAAGSGDRAATPTPPLPGPPSDAALPPRAVASVIGTAAPGEILTLSYEGTKGGDIRLRWVQVEGPIVVIDDPTAARARVVVPDAPGVLGFLLAVGNSAGIEATRVALPIVPRTHQRALVDRSGRPDGDQVRFLLSGVPLATEAAEDLAAAFDDVAGRVDLYRCYDDLFSELSRRLDGVVPRDPPTRAVWVERVFLPLTDRLIDELRPEGLDLRQPEGRSTPLKEPQRKRLAEVFHALAQGARVPKAR